MFCFDGRFISYLSVDAVILKFSIKKVRLNFKTIFFDVFRYRESIAHNIDSDTIV